MTKGQYFDLVNKELESIKGIIKAKNADYTGGSDNPFANFEDTGGLVSPLVGVILRMGDKMQRLRSFAKKGKLQTAGEGAEDAARDMIGYSLIVIGLLKKDIDAVDPKQPGKIILREGGKYLRRDGKVVTLKKEKHPYIAPFGCKEGALMDLSAAQACYASGENYEHPIEWCTIIAEVD